MVVLRVCRAGWSNQGLYGGRCDPGVPLALWRIFPFTSQKRRRVRILLIRSLRFQPVLASRQRRAPFLFIFARNFPDFSDLSTRSTSAEYSRVWPTVHWGMTPA